MSTPLPVLIGPTGIGKSEVALLLAEQLGADLLLLDAYKVYRELHLGVTKPSPADRRRVAHFGLDLLSVFEEGNVERIVAAAEETIESHLTARRPLIVEGNAPLYLKILFEGMFEGPGRDPAIRAALTAEAETVGVAALHRRLAAVDPVAGARIEANDLRRIVRALEVFQLTGRPISDFQGQWGRLREDRQFAVVGLRMEKELLWRRMQARVEALLGGGWLDECHVLLALETPERPLARTAAQAEGYHELFDLLRRGGSLEGVERKRIAEAIFIGHRQNARRAMQWYRKWPYVTWIERAEQSTPERLAEQVRAAWRASGAAQ
ncbi:MAG: tRNA (adenosine(37)-N6)-dimethylallyltransferase MiaA [Planctomycetota bacterium]